MNRIEQPHRESGNPNDFIGVMNADTARQSPLSVREHTQKGRIDLDHEKTKNGLTQLVLTLVKLLHELLERQAIRRIDAGSLSDDEIERIGVTLMRQTEEIERLRKVFGLEEKDLNIDLGPLGRLL